MNGGIGNPLSGNESRSLEELRVEVSQLKENHQFLLNYYRMRVTEKTEELTKLKRIHTQKHSK